MATKLGSTARKRATNPTQPTGTWIRSDKRLAIILRDGNACVYCGRSLKRAPLKDRTLDHVSPLETSATPDHGESNLVVACRFCNGSKGVGDVPRAARAKVRAQIAKDLAPYRAQAKALIARHGSYTRAVNAL